MRAQDRCQVAEVPFDAARGVHGDHVDADHRFKQIQRLVRERPPGLQNRSPRLAIISDSWQYARFESYQTVCGGLELSKSYVVKLLLGCTPVMMSRFQRCGAESECEAVNLSDRWKSLVKANENRETVQYYVARRAGCPKLNSRARNPGPEPNNG